MAVRLNQPAIHSITMSFRQGVIDYQEGHEKSDEWLMTPTKRLAYRMGRDFARCVDHDVVTPGEGEVFLRQGQPTEAPLPGPVSPTPGGGFWEDDVFRKRDEIIRGDPPD